MIRKRIQKTIAGLLIVCLLTALLPPQSGTIVEASEQIDKREQALNDAIRRAPNARGLERVVREQEKGRSLDEVYAATKRSELLGTSYEVAVEELFAPEINPSGTAIAEVTVDPAFNGGEARPAIELEEAWVAERGKEYRATEAREKQGAKPVQPGESSKPELSATPEQPGKEKEHEHEHEHEVASARSNVGASVAVQVLSATNPALEQPPVYTHGSFGQAPFSVGDNNEAISTLSGSLTLEETDMTLPGRNGLSFALTRQYNSDQAQFHDMGFGSSSYLYDMTYYFVTFYAFKREILNWYDVKYNELMALQHDYNNDGISDYESIYLTMTPKTKAAFRTYSAAQTSLQEGVYYSGSPAASMQASGSRTSNSSSPSSFPATIPYSSNGYSGTLSKSGAVTQISGTFTPAASRTETASCTNTIPGRYSSTGQWQQTGSETNPCPSSISYNSGGFSGTLSRTSTTTVKACASPGTPNWVCTKEFRANYSGTVTRPASDTRVWQQNYAGTVYRPDTRTTFKYGPWYTVGNRKERTVHWIADKWIEQRQTEGPNISVVMGAGYTPNQTEIQQIRTQVNNKTYPLPEPDGEYNYYYAPQPGAQIQQEVVQHVGYTYYNTTSVPKVEQLYPIGKGWSWNLPYMEIKDGKRYLTLAGEGTYEISNNKLLGYPWEGVSFTAHTGVSVNGESSAFVLSTVEDDIKQYFTSDGRLLQISDGYNNKLLFFYQHHTTYGRRLLTEVRDAIGNAITIAYSPTQVTVTKGNQVVTYKKRTEQGKELLESVTDAEGRKTTYSYRLAAASFNLMDYAPERALSNPYALLTQVQHPTGGRTEYDWSASAITRKIGPSSVNGAYRVQARRDAIVRAQGDPDVYNRQSFSYSADYGASWGQDLNFTTTMDNFLTSTTYHYKKDYINSTTPTQFYLQQEVTSAADQVHTTTHTYGKTVGSTPYPVNVPTTTVRSSSLNADTLTTTRTYNNYGKVTQETDELGNTSTYTYDAKQLLATAITPVDTNKTLHTTYTRNDKGRVTRMEVRENGPTGPLVQHITYGSYDSYGNLGTLTVQQGDGSLNTTEFEYNVAHQYAFLTRQRKQVTNADGQSSWVETRATYQLPTGQMLTHTDGAGHTVQLQYDKLDRVRQVTYADQSTFRIAYDDVNNTVTTTDETGHQMGVAYNPLGLKTGEGYKVGSELEVLKSYVYDPFSRVAETADALGNRTLHTYDSWNRVAAVQQPDGHTQTITYNDAARIVTRQDAQHYALIESLDKYGRRVQLQERAHATATPQTLELRTYHPVNGQVQSLTDGKNQTTTYSYDSWGRLQAVTNALNETTSYAYDRLGGLLQVVHPDLSVKSYTRDELGRVIRMTDEEGRLTRLYYDGNGNVVRRIDRNNTTHLLTYDSRNRLLTQTDPDGTVQLSYDLAGRRTTMVDSLGTTSYTYAPLTGLLSAIVYPDGRSATMSYNANLQRTQLTDPFGVQTHYQYDAMQRLASVGTQTGQPEASFTYNASGLLQQRTHTNGVSTTYQYTGLDLTGVTHSTQQNTLTHHGYSYDAVKNITGRLTQQAQAAPVQDLFTYDSLNRIQTSSMFNELYQYDVRGNRSQLQSDRDIDLSPASYTYNAKNQLASVVKDDEQVMYRYNGDGLLTERVHAGITHRYYYDDSAQMIAEAQVVSGQSQHVASYIRGNQLELIVYPNGSKAYAYTNGHGDIVALRSAAGQELNRYDYDIWGNPTEAVEQVHNPFRYSGELWDDVTQLQYLRARWYDPNEGRFLTEDTYEGELNNPLSLNLYTYVHNNPLRYHDPSGNIPVLIAIFGKAVLNYSIDVMIGVAMDYLSHLTTGATFNLSRSLKKNAAESVVPGVGIVKKTKMAFDLAKDINKAQKAAKAGVKCNCFTAGTKVLTDEGEKNIEDIEVGDKVLAKDENNPDGELAYKEVTNLYRNQRDDIIKLHVGEQVIETTDNHPFWVEGKGWVFADELQVGDKLQKADRSNLTIEKVEFVKLDEPVTVYNFTVADYHTYYVTDIGIWVHNTNCGYKDITVGKSVRNIETNVTRADFEKSLIGDGWKKSVSKDGKVTIYSKDGAQYTVRDTSNQGQPTAEYWAKGATEVTTKIRLGSN